MGQAVDANGAPLANARIVVNNTQFYNSTVLGQTDANGQYSLAVSPGSWYVRGTIKTTFDGKPFTLDLHPDTDAAFAGTDGAVRNLSLKIAGQRTHEHGNNGYYGGHIELYAWGLPTDQLTLTLKPVGTLMDGSAGKTLTVAPDNGSVHDVPLGKYTISARLGSQALRVRIRNANQTYGTSVTSSFNPAYAGAEGRYKLDIEIED